MGVEEGEALFTKNLHPLLSRRNIKKMSFREVMPLSFYPTPLPHLYLFPPSALKEVKEGALPLFKNLPPSLCESYKKRGV
jgi:hypothetical protein